MKNSFAAAILAAVLAGAGWAHAAGTVQVSWVQPEHFADIGRGDAERARTMDALGTHLQRLGRLLPPGQTLAIEVLDVDLAGQIEWLRWQDVRVLRGGADWPRMRLRYTLQADGRTLASGEERLSELNFLARAASGDLAYEKQMLERWFRDTFAAP